MAQTKAEQDNVGEFLEDDVIKETKAEEGLIDQVSNFHNNCTICNIFHDVKSLNQHFFVKSSNFAVCEN